MHNKIYVLGVSTSGKSTISEKLAKRIKGKHFDLDDFYYKNKYDNIRSEKEIEKLVKKALKNKKWVIEGSYSSSRWVKWIAKSADIVVWLDRPSHVLAWRIVKRTIKRGRPKKVKEIFGLLSFLYRYKTRGNAERHRKIVLGHERGYILKTNKQIDDFLNNF